MVLMLICWDFYFLITGELPLDIEKIIEVKTRHGRKQCQFLVLSNFLTGERECLEQDNCVYPPGYVKRKLQSKSSYL